MRTDRRSILAAGLGGACALAAPAFAQQRGRGGRDGADADADGPPLRDRTARKGLLYGVALQTRHLTDPPLAEAAAREANLLVPEYEAQWRIIHPEPQRYDYRAIDRLEAFAREHRMQFRGHSLVWHLLMAQWIQGAIATRAGAERTLVEHITTVVGHTKGRAHSWDVVNEAIDDGNPEMRRTPWFNALGADYIDIAFRTARQADDRVLLSYNEYGIQHGDANSDRKRAAVLRLLEGMRRRNVPVDALGVQSHLSAGLPFDEQKFRRFIGEVAGMGLKVFISELDVRDRDLPGDADPRDRAVAELTRRFLDAALDERAVKVVVTWGVSDRHSWLNDVANSRRTDGQPVRGLPLDDRMARKPMWRAMAAAFDAAPAR